MDVMNPQQAIEFIRQQLIQGQGRLEIEQVLRLNNIPENEIALAFNAAEWQKNQNVPSPQRRRRWGWLIGILVLLLVATGAGAYVVLFQPDLVNQILNKTPAIPPVPVPVVITPTPTAPLVVAPVATSTDMTNWKTYRNEKYEFEIEYPSDFVIKDFGEPDYLEGLGLSLCGGEYSNSCGIKGAGSHSEIYLFRFNKDGKRKELYSFVFGGGKFPRDEWPWGNTLDKINCTIASKEISGSLGKLWDCGIGLFVFWQKENSFYVMDVSFLDVFPNLRDTFLKILNTFRFTNSVDTANWKTYRSDQFGYEIKYPPTWRAIHPGTGGDVWLSEPPLGRNGVWETGGIEIRPNLEIGSLYEPQGPKTFKEYIAKAKATKIVLGDKEFYKTLMSRISVAPAGSQYYLEIDNQHMFSIGVFDKQNQPLNPKLVEQILSTFRFTSTSTATTDNFYKVKLSLNPGVTESKLTGGLREKLLSVLGLREELLSTYRLSATTASLDISYDSTQGAHFVEWANRAFMMNVNNEYFLLLRNDASPLDLQKVYKTTEITATLSRADSALLPFVRNSEYCQADSDCSLGHNFCGIGAYNKFRGLPQDAAWGCEGSIEQSYPQENTKELLAMCDATKQYPSVKYGSSKCLNNKCVPQNRVVTCEEGTLP